jgi:hypothetical protein
VTRPIDLLREGRKNELWDMCCGFIDLPMEEFMKIQKRLLLEQIELLKESELGRKVMRHAMPNSIDDFRNTVPFTTYADYCPELPQRREDVLPAKPAFWTRTSGYSGTYETKWVPISPRFAEEYEKAAAACALFGLSRFRGDLESVGEHWKILYTVGGLEYASGMIGHLMQNAFNFDFLPSHLNGETFTEKIRMGFVEALYQGLDGFGGLPSVLVTVGQQMQEQPKKPPAKFLLAHPGAAVRLAKGLAKSKMAGRSLLPKDLWDIKIILGGGTDSAVFSKKVEEMWGRRPLELYAGTEGGVYATQTWDYEGLTPIPNLNFFEFIPEDEHLKWQLNPSYQPRTLLLDEVEPGRNYEVVITNLHGGALVRFRLGDMITITARRNDNLNIDIPQMVFYGRADYVIDIAGLGRLTEKIIWEAIENTGIPYTDWTARKEVKNDRSVLHVYIEPKTGTGPVSESQFAECLGREFQKLEERYHHNPYNIYDEADAPPAFDSQQFVEVSYLPQGAFTNYIAFKQAEGADLGHLKPPHVNPTDRVLSLLSAEKLPVSAEAVAAGR